MNRQGFDRAVDDRELVDELDRTAGEVARQSDRKARRKRNLLLREGVPMRGERVELREARLPPTL